MGLDQKVVLRTIELLATRVRPMVEARDALIGMPTWEAAIATR